MGGTVRLMDIEINALHADVLHAAYARRQRDQTCGPSDTMLDINVPVVEPGPTITDAGP